MRRIPHQLVTGLLLAIYGGIAVLGYGLHELVPEDAHHHHHRLAAAHQEPGPVAFRSGGAADDDHDCDICVFLDQARSDKPQVAASIIWQHVIAAIDVVGPRVSSQTTLVSHAPRGPPAFIG
jgi:hypothetical protein